MTEEEGSQLEKRANPISKDLEKVIERRLSMEKAEMEKERERKRLGEARLSEHYQFEREHREEKLRILLGIETWASEFVKTKVYEKLLEFDERIDIYGGKWGHEGPSNDSRGCWSFVTLYEDGRLEYNAGYKWMGVDKRFFVNEDNIDKINLDYLRNINITINEGRVYDYMKRTLEGEMENDLLLKFRAKKKEMRKKDE